MAPNWQKVSSIPGRIHKFESTAGEYGNVALVVRAIEFHPRRPGKTIPVAALHVIVMAENRRRTQT